jgi:hypothetical protein
MDEIYIIAMSTLAQHVATGSGNSNRGRGRGRRRRTYDSRRKRYTMIRLSTACHEKRQLRLGL